MAHVYSLVFNKILTLLTHMTFHSVSAVIGYAAGYKRVKKYNNNNNNNNNNHVGVTVWSGVALCISRGGETVWCCFVGLSWWFVAVVWLYGFLVVVWLCGVSLWVYIGDLNCCCGVALWFSRGVVTLWCGLALSVSRGGVTVWCGFLVVVWLVIEVHGLLWLTGWRQMLVSWHHYSGDQ